ncbi:MAG: hypothetical protein JXD19_10950 [Deltaproteobacteria bacterium]|nr:hypothetical protein [Deltaproteobacteria bacterium]
MTLRYPPEPEIPAEEGQSFSPPIAVFGEAYQTVVQSLVQHSPFPRAQSTTVTHGAKLKAALIHLQETVFFGQVAYNDLRPTQAVEVCAGFGIPSITLNKLFGVAGTCVDTDSEKMTIGSEICEKLGINITWLDRDLFLYLRKNIKSLRGTTLLATAAYSRDRNKGRPPGSGERDIVIFAKNNHLDLALLPYRSKETIKTGLSNETKRVQEYEKILKDAGYTVRRHSTEVLFRGQGAPDWFFLDILTAKFNS